MSNHTTDGIKIYNKRPTCPICEKRQGFIGIKTKQGMKAICGTCNKKNREKHLPDLAHIKEQLCQ